MMKKKQWAIIGYDGLHIGTVFATNRIAAMRKWNAKEGAAIGSAMDAVEV